VSRKPSVEFPAVDSVYHTPAAQNAMGVWALVERLDILTEMLEYKLQQIEEAIVEGRK
jgi:hypothetical protein